MRKQIVIIGAGPGGLAAAMLLARNDVQVTVLERRDRVGGRTSAIRGGGFTFDTGPTFFLYPQLLAEIYAACGRTLEDEVELIPLDPQYHLVFEQGGSLRATGDVERMEREIARLCPADVPGLKRLLADNRAKLKAFKPVLERPFNGPADLLAPALIRSLPLLRPHLPVDRDLRRYFADPRIRLAFSFQSKYLGMTPFQYTSLLTILSFLEYEYGVFHPRGGCNALMTSMAEVAAGLGAEIRIGEAVEEILFSGRRATGVRTRSGTHSADAIVINADFARTMTALVPDRLRRRWSDARLVRKRFSCSTFMMYLGIEGRIDGLAHHTILLAEDYAGNLATIEQGGAPPQMPSLYVQNACATDPDLAPPGHSTLYVLVPVAHCSAGIDWSREAEPYRAVVLRRLEAIGIRDIERRIRFEKVVTPDDWAVDHAIHRGAVFNLAHTLGQMLHLRPRNRFEDLDGVYLVGGGTHPGSGLPVIFQSARISARLLERDLGLAPRAGRDWSAAAPGTALPLPARAS